jgi:hypothetical protein
LKRENKMKTNSTKIRVATAISFVFFLLVVNPHGLMAQSNTFPTTGNAGVGTTSPSGIIHTSVAGYNSMYQDSYGASRASVLFGRIAGGTAASPSIVASGDIMWDVRAQGYDGATFQNAAIIRTAIDGTPSAGIVPGRIQFFTTNASGTLNEQMRIDKGGNVGIGTTAPSATLHVQGTARVTGNLTVDGNIAAKYQDVAEWVASSQALSAGTVVVLDHTKSNHVIASSQAYDTRVAGVISKQPGIALGERGNGKVLVATVGRVKVRVDAFAGAIQVGDLLVTGDKEGVAMKSRPLNIGGVQLHRPGTIVGKALEPLAKGTREVLVLLTLQ